MGSKESVKNYDQKYIADHLLIYRVLGHHGQEEAPPPPLQHSLACGKSQPMDGLQSMVCFIN